MTDSGSNEKLRIVPTVGGAGATSSRGDTGTEPAHDGVAEQHVGWGLQHAVSLGVAVFSGSNEKLREDPVSGWLGLNISARLGSIRVGADCRTDDLCVPGRNLSIPVIPPADFCQASAVPFATINTEAAIAVILRIFFIVSLLACEAYSVVTTSRHLTGQSAKRFLLQLTVIVCETC